MTKHEKIAQLKALLDELEEDGTKEQTIAFTPYPGQIVWTWDDENRPLKVLGMFQRMAGGYYICSDGIAESGWRSCEPIKDVWQFAPPNAEWFAVNLNGIGNWHSAKPAPYTSSWGFGEDVCGPPDGLVYRIYYAPSPYENWKNSLQQRPR